MFVLATEHQGGYLAHRCEGRELLVWQDVHFYLVVEEPITLCLTEFDEKGRQPEIVNFVIDVYMEISDTIEV